MNLSPENYFTIGVAILYLLGGLYLILTGILALSNREIKIPGLYQLGVLISKIMFGPNRAASFEKDMLDRKKAIRYSVFWILIGLVSVAGAIFLIFAK